MDPGRLLIFRTVARAGSLSGAARELGWTQPAVSQHLQRLEREAGTPLLLRSTRGVTLTEAGRVLLARADGVASELHMATEELAGLAQRHTGRVRLIAFPTAAATLVPAALRLLADDHPGIEVVMTETEPPEAWAAVREGEADLVLVFSYADTPPDPGGPVWTPLADETVELVVPGDHPAARGPVRLAELAGETWIGGCARCRHHLVDRCRAAGFEPRLAHSSDDYVAVQSLIGAGLGVSMLPASALRAFRHPRVAVRSDPTLGRRTIGMAHRPGAELVPATAALIERVRRVTGG